MKFLFVYEESGTVGQKIIESESLEKALSQWRGEWFDWGAAIPKIISITTMGDSI
jgi:hypothetical protein